MKYPPKSIIVISDNYQVMLTVIPKKTVHIIRTNVWSIAHQFPRTCTAVHATGRLPCRWHAATDQTTQQRRECLPLSKLASWPHEARFSLCL